MELVACVCADCGVRAGTIVLSPGMGHEAPAHQVFASVAQESFLTCQCLRTLCTARSAAKLDMRAVVCSSMVTVQHCIQWNHYV